MSKFNNISRRIYNRYQQSRLQNRNFSLIASNCNGGVMLHDLGLRFNSPFVNLWVRPTEFVLMCENLSYYLGQDLEFIREDDISYPIGLLGGGYSSIFHALL
ncbi:MAG: DUF1919 domain-containing protein [Selenomonadaceae bacterium]|nr:DUF1919 domain-containing protein [Selenomonadaceae bacterium]